MADITRWDPFAELATLRNTMDRFFEDRPLRLAFGNGATENYFPVDLYETAEEVVVKASLPGVKPEDIDISVTGQLLTLKAESKQESEEKGQNYYRRERRAGTFVRQLTLPSEVESNKADATFEDGVLSLKLPKAEAMKPKTIKVSTRPVIESKS
jgi:HSP20 family protein